MDELRRTQDSLRVLAEETGGFATIDANSLTSAFDRLVDSNSRYYVLGYTPPEDAQNGRFHKIDLRTKRPGLKVIGAAWICHSASADAGRSEER